MHFNMSRERVEHLKEYFIKLLKHELFYEEFAALKEISLEIEKGDVFGIVGLNGSGKSTLLKVIAGVLRPTAGTVRVQGSIAPLIELGAGFDMDLTARENIFLNGAVLGFSRAQMRERYEEILEFSELQAFSDVPLKNFSSGMVARVGFAIATITRPDILIIDEILAVGDFRFQEKCERRIREMMSGGTTVILVSHSIEQIERLCSRVLWLEKGRSRMLGSMREVCEAYKNS
ncbi:MAG: ABC transporter ATP-binding protein [Provencibacterium sp.]|jgi:ABC-2 type transport system ATP-binding protein|nr:ABC transporter ATP-binding protein [Provencibacterium sp.]